MKRYTFLSFVLFFCITFQKAPAAEGESTIYQSKSKIASQNSDHISSNAMIQSATDINDSSDTIVIQLKDLPESDKKIILKRVPAGTFMMGDEVYGPVHKVTITKDYYLSIYEITQAQWNAVKGNNPSSKQGDDLPVVTVPKPLCEDFNNTVNTKKLASFTIAAEQRSSYAVFRLPTEAEWEYACRAGTTTKFFWGNSDQPSIDTYSWNRSLLQKLGRTGIQPVGTLKSNPWGFFDMAGNCREWCQDIFAPYPSEDQTDPVNNLLNGDTIIRGGSYDEWPIAPNSMYNTHRSSWRGHAPGSWTLNDTGFRVAMDATWFDTPPTPTPTPSLTPTPKPGDTLPIQLQGLSASNKQIILQRIPAGTFMMGDESNSPIHKVTLTKDYYMSIYEITQAQWQAVMGYNPSSNKGNDLPVESVAKVLCDNFIKTVNTQKIATFKLPNDSQPHQAVFRLPTEAEWEYACRAGTTTNYFWGNNDQPDINTYSWNIYLLNKYSLNGIQPVGYLKPNPWGLFDMAGNCREWCQDTFAPYNQWDQVDPVNLSSGGDTVIRGGSYAAWPSAPDNMINTHRSSWREHVPGEWVLNDTGFRIVMDAAYFDITPTPTPSFSPSSTFTFTPVSTSTFTLEPVATSTFTPNLFPSDTPKPVSTPVLIPTSTFTSTSTLIPTATFTPTPTFTPIPTQQPTNTPKPGNYIPIVLNGLSGDKKQIILKRIPAGTFMMGDDYNGPVHKVTLTKDYYMSIYEITQAQWQAVMGSNPSAVRGDNLPVESVAKPICESFIKTINSNKLANFENPDTQQPANAIFRLPTEAEWEYACRAGTSTNFFWGNSDLPLIDQYAWNRSLLDKLGLSGIQPAGSLQPNPWGLYDMAGNCREWCRDLFAPYNAADQIDPVNLLNGENTVIRGGSFDAWPGQPNTAYNTHRSSWREQAHASWVLANTGFRIVMDADVLDTPPSPTPTKTYTNTPSPIQTAVATATATAAATTTPMPISGDVVPIKLKGLADINKQIILRRIPAGSFMMGDDYNGPVHKVTLTKDYYISIYEITQAQWQAVMGTNPSSNRGENLPVEMVPKPSCEVFLNKISKDKLANFELPGTQGSSNAIFRLPTEAEWEYACRAGTTTNYFWGNSDQPLINDYSWNLSLLTKLGLKGTQPVGSLKPNLWGLYDMAGNCREWCQDFFAPYSPNDQVDPVNLISGENTVIRGGSYDTWPGEPNSAYNTCRSSWREQAQAGWVLPNTSFRVVMDASLFDDPPTPTPTASPTNTPTSLQTPSATPTPEPGDYISITLTGLAQSNKQIILKRIPASTFMMGDEQNGPIHKVTLTNDFYISTCEITQAQWQAVMGTNPSTNKGDNLPVETVPKQSCEAFNDKISTEKLAYFELPGTLRSSYAVFRLPTEAEWEYACRAGSTTNYFWGNSDQPLIDVYSWNLGLLRKMALQGTQPVGSLKSNPWGLYDMAGNCREWCQDFFAPYQANDQVNPVNLTPTDYTVMRGGSYDTWPGDAYDTYRSSWREKAQRGWFYANTSFRVVMDASWFDNPPTPTPTPTPKLTPTPTATPKPGDYVTIKLKGLAETNKPIILRRIPAGSFTMGDEVFGPVHKVTLSNDFYMSIYEITQAQWQAIMGNNPSANKGGDLPVETVPKLDCETFNNIINTQKIANFDLLSGSGSSYAIFRLPTEAEWEYACRAGSTTNFFWGDNDQPLINEYSWNRSLLTNLGIKGTQTVGILQPNQWGLYDMAGNCREWCQDIYAPYTNESKIDPLNLLPFNGDTVVRGGSYDAWPSEPNNMYNTHRSSWREHVAQGWFSLEIGFRVVMDAAWFDTPPTPTPTQTPLPTPKPIQSITLPLNLSPDVERPLNLIHVDAGSFFMGNDHVNGDTMIDESPQHYVTITNDYYLGMFEVTQSQWKLVMGETPGLEFNDPDRPIESVTWNQCYEFLTKLNQMNENQWNKQFGQFDLPSEAEWEYACRAGTQTEFFWGNDASQYSDYAWINQIGPAAKDRSMPVGNRKPNLWGFYNMACNVHEWCKDGFENYKVGSQIDPLGVNDEYKVLRGGCYSNVYDDARSSYRVKMDSGSGGPNGFRIIMRTKKNPDTEPVPTPTPSPLNTNLLPSASLGSTMQGYVLDKENTSLVEALANNLNRMKADNLMTIRYFVEMPKEYNRYMINFAKKNGMKVIMVFSCAPWNITAPILGYPPTKEGYGSYVYDRLYFLDTIDPAYIGNTVTGIQIGNEEEVDTKWGYTDDDGCPGKDYLGIGQQFADYYLSARDAIKRKWPNLQILSGSLQNDMSIDSDVGGYKNNWTNDNGQYARAFLNGFIQTIIEKSGNLNKLPDIIAYNGYPGKQPPEGYVAGLAKDYVYRVQTLRDICSFYHYYPLFANTEYGFSPDGDIESKYGCNQANQKTKLCIICGGRWLMQLPKN